MSSALIAATLVTLSSVNITTFKKSVEIQIPTTVNGKAVQATLKGTVSTITPQVIKDDTQILVKKISTLMLSSELKKYLELNYCEKNYMLTGPVNFISNAKYQYKENIFGAHNKAIISVDYSYPNPDPKKPRIKSAGHIVCDN